MKPAALLLATSVLILSGCSTSTGPSERPPYPEISDLVVFYAFDGTYENEVADAHHGTPSRAVTFVPGRHIDPDAGPIGQAIHVDPDDYVLVADDPEFDITDAITVAAWVNPEASNQAVAGVVWKDHAEAWCLAMWGGIADPETTNIKVYISGSQRNTEDIIPMGMDTWSHIAFTYSDATNRLRYYFNGAIVDSDLIAGPIGVSDADLLIGNAPGAGRYKGKIDEVAIFDRALSASEINELFTF